jgi:hypothetical protein
VTSEERAGTVSAFQTDVWATCEPMKQWLNFLPTGLDRSADCGHIVS